MDALGAYRRAMGFSLNIPFGLTGAGRDDVEEAGTECESRCRKTAHLICLAKFSPSFSPSPISPAALSSSPRSLRRLSSPTTAATMLSGRGSERTNERTNRRLLPLPARLLGEEEDEREEGKDREGWRGT